MWIRWLLLVVVLTGCKSRSEAPVEMPTVAPSDAVVSWGMIGRNAQRDTMYMEIRGDRSMTIVTKSPSGTMVSVEQTVSEDKYRELVRQLRDLDCCSLMSTTESAPSPLETKPELGINFGDLACQVSLWDSEWRAQKARACGEAVASIHGRTFVTEDPNETAAR